VLGMLAHRLARVVIEQGSALFGPGPDEPSRADGMRPRRPGGRPPALWRIEVTGLGAAGRAENVRVTLIDAQHGRRVGAAVVPFDWFRDIGHNGTCTVEIDPGSWA